jgi:hypothetical protein
MSLTCNPPPKHVEPLHAGGGPALLETVSALIAGISESRENADPVRGQAVRVPAGQERTAAHLQDLEQTGIPLVVTGRGQRRRSREPFSLA